MDIENQLDALLSDPLEELWELQEAEMNRVSKPALQDEPPGSNVGPNNGNFQHPVIQQRNQMNDFLGMGMNPVQAHQSVYGEVDTGNIESKAALASSLGRIADDGSRSDIKADQGKEPSIYAKDKRYEKAMDQVTRDDLRTPMNQQVPDRQQQPVDQVESLEIAEECDYNEDVRYLQKFGRA